MDETKEYTVPPKPEDGDKITVRSTDEEEGLREVSLPVWRFFLLSIG
jgi:hypothetical protein